MCCFCTHPPPCKNSTPVKGKIDFVSVKFRFSAFTIFSQRGGAMSIHPKLLQPSSNFFLSAIPHSSGSPQQLLTHHSPQIVLHSNMSGQC